MSFIRQTARQLNACRRIATAGERQFASFALRNGAVGGRFASAAQGALAAGSPASMMRGAVNLPGVSPLFRSLAPGQARSVSTFAQSYNKHVDERKAEGIVPKPLDAKQVSELVKLAENPPAGAALRMEFERSVGEHRANQTVEGFRRVCCS
eukprot:9399003-Pyramimonas_sp.AAC.1